MMASPAPIIRRALRDEVYERVLARIHSGEFAPGTRLSDVALAEDLGVSRTPVREALLRLSRERIVAADLGHGFVVRPLVPDEVRDAYPILWTLEGLALRLSPTLPSETVAALDALTASMENAGVDWDALLRLDREWHALLLSRCPNEPLLTMIETLKNNLVRYERAYMQEAGNVRQSVSHHARVTAALADGDVDAAVEWLEHNWRYGMSAVLDSIERSRDERAGEE